MNKPITKENWISLAEYFYKYKWKWNIHEIGFMTIWITKDTTTYITLSYASNKTKVLSNHYVVMHLIELPKVQNKEASDD